LDSKVSGASGVFADIFGPHAGELLTHCTERVFHSASPDGVTTGGQSPVAVALGEDLEEGDGVWVGTEEGVDILGSAEMIPPRPMVVKGTGAAWSNTGSDRCLNKAEVSAEFMCVRR
jgi:hypothetical protein